MERRDGATVDLQQQAAQPGTDHHLHLPTRYVTTPATNQQPPQLSVTADVSLSSVPQQVDARSLAALCDFLRERRPLLLSEKLRPPQDLNRLPYATLRSLRVNTLVHALLRVTHTHISTGKFQVQGVAMVTSNT